VHPKRFTLLTVLHERDRFCVNVHGATVPAVHVLRT
jgi:hypothetical protein